MPIPIATLEDDAAFTETLKIVIEAGGTYQIVESFRNPIHFLSQLPQLHADIFLLDICLPKLSGLDCLNEVRREHPDSHILIMSVSDSDEHVLSAFLNGADGYLLKDQTPEQICKSIDDVCDGGAPMSPSIARKVVRLLGKLGNNPDVQPNRAKKSVAEKLLTPREFEILLLLAEGLRYGEIASQLFISLDTVKTHVRHIYEKLRVRNKTEAISRLLR